MKLIKRIVFWEPSTSPHKVDFYSSIVNLNPSVEVICCAQTDFTRRHKDIGWTFIPNKLVKTFINPPVLQIEGLIANDLESTLHIFSGIRWVPIIVTALKLVKNNHANFAIMSEPRESEGFFGLIRFIQSWLSESWIKKNVKFILAQGANGPLWFNSIGYNKEIIFPFAYFINPPPDYLSYRSLSKLSKKPIQVAYIGRLVKMKGIFDLVKAIHIFGNNIKLNIVGSGSAKFLLKNKCDFFCLKVNFFDHIPLYKIYDFLSEMDVLVLASTAKDGWGVVVSEALMSGVAVICTPNVGASIMLDYPIFGIKVPPHSPKSIADSIKYLKHKNLLSMEVRKKRAAFSRQKLSANAGAKYLIEIINFRFHGGPSPLAYYNA